MATKKNNKPLTKAQREEKARLKEEADNKAKATERLEDIHKSIVSQFSALGRIRNGELIDAGLREFFLSDVRTSLNRAAGKAFGAGSLLDKFNKKKAREAARANNN
jgi:hypothetical protein